jgi:hypothetical protein
LNLVTDIANQALDAAAVDFTLGDIEEGSRQAQVCLRAYRQCLQQLLRGAMWDFARKLAPLTLLADSSGQTPNVGAQTVPPWRFEYEYPIDCMKARFVPWNPRGVGGAIPAGNIQPPNPQLPLTSGPVSVLPSVQLRPARFLVATDFNYPPVAGQITWEVQGVSPQGRTVILTNVENASLVYTALMLYPSVWDSLFRAAMVSYLAAEVALPLAKDKKFGLALRKDNIAILVQKLGQARVANGNEGWATADLAVDWMNVRRTGGGYGESYSGGEAGAGVLGYGWDSCGGWDAGNSSAY